MHLVSCNLDFPTDLSSLSQLLYKDFQKELHALIRRVIKTHKRIIFNGNGYDDAWIKEAEGIEEFYKELGDRVPAELYAELDALKANLNK